MFDFLNEVTIEETLPQAAKKGGPRKERNPEGLAIRVFYDGSVFPSKELVSKFNLEYADRPKVAEGEKEPTITGFGFDVINSLLYPAFKLPEGKKVILISPVLKSAPKVDLFGSVNYDENGKAKNSVLDQGNKTYGADTLIPMLEEVYGITLKKLVMVKGETVDTEQYNDDPSFVDLEFIPNPKTDNPWESEVSYIPKKISRGADKGVITTVRRENLALYVLAQVIPTKEVKSEAKLTVDESVQK